MSRPTSHFLKFTIALAFVVALAPLAVRSAPAPVGIPDCDINQTPTESPGGAVCEPDPVPSDGSCNAEPCYDTGGFKLPAPTGCYKSWPRCSTTCLTTCEKNQTCVQQAGKTICIDDPSNASSTSCNGTKCYDRRGDFLKPAPLGCYGSWPKCVANVVLKVKKDRTCNVWMTCASSTTSAPRDGGAPENLCLSLAACNTMNDSQQCAKYLPTGQCSNDAFRSCAKSSDCVASNPPPTCNFPGVTGRCSNNPSALCTKNSDCPPVGTLTGTCFVTSDLTYTSPSQVDSIAALSGNVTAGMSWAQHCSNNDQKICTVATVLKDCGAEATCEPSYSVQGSLPWQMMRMVGGSAKIINSDFETNVPDTSPWLAGNYAIMNVRPEEVGTENSNNVLYVEPGRTPLGKYGTNTGAFSNGFSPDISSQYYITLRVKAPAGKPAVLVRFFKDEISSTTAPTSDWTCATCKPIGLNGAWQTIVAGPYSATATSGGDIRVGVVCSGPDNATSPTDNCGPFMVDDVQVRPMLQFRSDGATIDNFISPSCRLYPKDDSPSCDYTTTDGVRYRGWQGYCLEKDSVTGTCLSWWPIDIIKGETNIFANDPKTGYDSRQPLFYCAESEGYYNHPDPKNGTTVYDQNMMSTASTIGGFYDIPSQNFWTGRPAFLDKPLGYFQVASTAIGERIDTGGADTLTSGDYPCPIWPNGSFDTNRRGIFACHTSLKPDVNDGNAKVLLDTRNLDAGFTYNISPSCPDGICPASPQDQKIHAYDVEYVEAVPVFGFTAGTNNKWTSMPAIKFNGATSATHSLFGKNQPWAFSWTDNTNESYNAAGQLVWDPADQHLIGYKAYIEEGNDPSALWLMIRFKMRERCNKIVEVVTATGENKAWNQRLASGQYQVPDLGYKNATDVAPYGGLLSPSGYSSNPSDWPQPLYAEKPKAEFPYPSQARAGSPFACRGNCSVFSSGSGSGSFSCSVDDSNFCSTQDEVNRCQSTTAVVEGQEVVGTCMGVGSQAATLGTPQVTSPTPGQLSGNTQVFTSLRDTSSKVFAASRISRLFARSYGVWELKINPLTGAYTKDKPQYETITGDWSPPQTACNNLCSVQRSVSCSADGTKFGVGISYQGKNDAIAKASAMCKLQVACDGTSSICGGGTKANYMAVDESKVKCWMGGAVGLWQCFGPCTGASTYDQAGKSLNRPDFPDDFCGIPPRVNCPDEGVCDGTRTAQFTNTAAPELELDGDGSVSIKFNSEADGDQVPLDSVSINWGDGAIDTISYPYAPKNSGRDPHIYSHVYRKSSNAGEDSYNIRVRIKDNWGWCSNGVTGTPCPDWDAATNTGLTVKIHAR